MHKYLVLCALTGLIGVIAFAAAITSCYINLRETAVTSAASNIDGVKGNRESCVTGVSEHGRYVVISSAAENRPPDFVHPDFDGSAASSQNLLRDLPSHTPSLEEVLIIPDFIEDSSPNGGNSHIICLWPDPPNKTGANDEGAGPHMTHDGDHGPAARF